MTPNRSSPLPLRRNAIDPVLAARDWPYPAHGAIDLVATLDDLNGDAPCPSEFSSTGATRVSFIDANCGRGKSLYRAFQLEQAQVLLRMLAELERTCVACGIIGSCSGRIKSQASTYHKMQLRGISRREVLDSIGLRVIVSSVDDCYRLLKHLQTNHAQVDSQIRDYIASPKPNGYQSLHVTVVDDDGALIEIQLRTTAMHQIAERGTAAHSGYKAAVSDHFLRIPEVIACRRGFSASCRMHP